MKNLSIGTCSDLKCAADRLAKRIRPTAPKAPKADLPAVDYPFLYDPSRTKIHPDNRPRLEIPVGPPSDTYEIRVPTEAPQGDTIIIGNDGDPSGVVNFIV